MPESKTYSVNVREGQVRDAIVRIAEWLWDVLRLFTGGVVVLEVRRPVRSIKQNAAYWGYIIRPILIKLRAAGYEMSRDMLHEKFKEECLPVRTATYVDEETGEVVEFVSSRTTTTLTTTEFYEYCERIKQLEWVQHLQVPFEDRRLRDMIMDGSLEEAA